MTAAFGGSWFWALLGLIFVPWTTLMFTLVYPIVGFDWVWLGIAVLADISAYAAGAARRRDVSYYRGPELKDHGPKVNAYRLHLPANVPAANFWSVTLYDASNASGLDNGQPYPSIGSLDDLEYNSDGSVDLYFGPELPEGAPASNWLRTERGKGWFTLFRLYSPAEPFFDQSWKPEDFEKIV